MQEKAMADNKIEITKSLQKLVFLGYRSITKQQNKAATLAPTPSLQIIHMFYTTKQAWFR